MFPHAKDKDVRRAVEELRGESLSPNEREGVTAMVTLTRLFLTRCHVRVSEEEEESIASVLAKIVTNGFTIIRLLRPLIILVCQTR